MVFAVPALLSAQSSCSHEDRLAPEEPDLQAILTPDFAEAKGAPAKFYGAPSPLSFGVLASSVQQRQGVLSGKIVFMNSGHGWTFDPTYWRLQRGVGNSMNEDYGNLDQLNFFAAYCFNAGATVVSFRPLGHQTNEVVLDNDDSAVTFAGSWTDSTSTYFWGSPGNTPYRYSFLSNSETATATYTPTIPATGFYPIYTWVRAGSDRGEQLYRIRHTGGESQIRIPHHMVGNGWIYLGEYYLNAGSNAASGAVVVSNLRGSAQGTYTFADAIRFGNGMGTVNPYGTNGVSDYPREDESMRYWIQGNLAQGQSTSLYDGAGDDESDSWSAPPKMSAEMNRSEAGDIYDRIHISFHSNAGGGRGSVGLITSDPTPYQTNLAYLCGKEVNDDLVALGSPPLEVAPFNRTTFTYTGGYSEIDGSLFNYEMAATIIEVAYHDNASDALIMRDPTGRAAIGKAAMHAIVKFMNQYDTNHVVPLDFLPESPTNVSAIAGTNGQITIAWSAPVNIGGSESPTNYIIYRSTNGYGFGNPISVSNVTSYVITNLAADTDYYFRVTASNNGGESMPSEAVGCRASSGVGAQKVLVVNAYDRFGRFGNLLHDVSGQNWDPPGNSGSIERVFPRWINSFDYVVQHGKAISACGMAFDSCQNEAVASGQVNLSNYTAVIWACGNESTSDETFSSTEQTKVASFLANGGGFFTSGGEIGWDLDRTSGPTTADRNFFHTNLHAAYTNDDSGVYTVTNVAGSIFNGLPNATFDDGSKGIYMVGYPDVIGAFGSGASAALNYVGVSSGAAAIQYNGSAGGGKVVLFGFPFETITSANVRSQYMTAILNFLVPSAPSIATQPSNQTVVQGANATFSVVANGAAPLAYQWRFNGADISNATTNSYTRTNAQPADAGSYTVVVTNNSGSVTSDVATLTVNVPPTISVQPQSLTVTQGNNAMFTVTATGTPSPGYQWRFNGANISSATNSSYTRTGAQSGDAGSYTVVVTNVAGSITSSVATLTVLVPPSITAQPTNKTIALGSNATFYVTASGTATLGYQWRFNGTDISAATASSYTRSSAMTNDAGSYSVVITNMAGGITSSVAALTVVIPPSITAQPQNLLVWVGSNFTFSVSVTGDAPLNYQWRLNGTNIFGATTNPFTRLNAQTNDAGSYSVTVSNAAAVVTSSDARLTVVDAPPKFQLITMLPGNQFKLTVVGVPGSYLLESSGDLNGGWSSLTNLSNTNGVLEFTDSPSATATQRYYRALIVP